MVRSRLTSALCLGMLLLLPVWTLLLWWLQERMLIAVGLAALGVVVLMLLSFPRIHVPPAPAAHTTMCRLCGYNLRGNLSGVCPECGTNLLHPSTVPASEDELPTGNS